MPVLASGLVQAIRDCDHIIIASLYKGQTLIHADEPVWLSNIDLKCDALIILYTEHFTHNILVCIELKVIFNVFLLGDIQFSKNVL